MYTGDVRKQPATYRIPRDLLAAVTVEAAERGETVTVMVIRSMEAYIQRGEASGIAPRAPVAEVTVHTVPESPGRYEEAPERPACKHPADRVDTDTGQCGACGADVW
jgi:hypothetical protein